MLLARTKPNHHAPAVKYAHVRPVSATMQAVRAERVETVLVHPPVAAPAILAVPNQRLAAKRATSLVALAVKSAVLARLAHW